MAKTNKADMSCARVKKYTASDVSKAERHNERKNETYENMNVIVERIPFNVHFKKPTAPTYMEQLKQMETDGQVSLRGLRKDATLFNAVSYTHLWSGQTGWISVKRRKDIPSTSILRSIDVYKRQYLTCLQTGKNLPARTL